MARLRLGHGVGGVQGVRRSAPATGRGFRRARGRPRHPRHLRVPRRAARGRDPGPPGPIVGGGRGGVPRAPARGARSHPRPARRFHERHRSTTRRGARLRGGRGRGASHDRAGRLDGVRGARPPAGSRARRRRPEGGDRHGGRRSRRRDRATEAAADERGGSDGALLARPQRARPLRRDRPVRKREHRDGCLPPGDPGSRLGARPGRSDRRAAHRARASRQRRGLDGGPPGAGGRGMARAARARPARRNAGRHPRSTGASGQHARDGSPVRGVFEGVHAQRRALTLLLAGLVLLAVMALRGMPSSILPEVSFPRVKVIVNSGELPSAVMLRDVTRTLEESIRRVPGVTEIRSTTSRGSAEINLDSRWGTDLNLTVQRVQSQIEAARTNLPAGTTVDVRLMNPTLFPVLGLSMTSDHVPLAQLRDFADQVLRPELSRLPGVAEVVIQGGRRLEARVTLDPIALESRGLDPASVADGVRKASTLQSVGLLETNAQLYLGLVDGRPRDLQSLDSLMIAAPSGPPVMLGQLGRISLEEAPEFQRYRANSREAVLINLLRQPSASATTLSDAAHRWFAENKARLPRGVTIQTFYDQSDLVHASVGSVDRKSVV